MFLRKRFKTGTKIVTSLISPQPHLNPPSQVASCCRTSLPTTSYRPRQRQRQFIAVAAAMFAPLFMFTVFAGTPSRADAFLFFGSKKTKDAAYYLHKADIHLERRGRLIWRPLAISEYQKALSLSNTVVDAKRSQLGIGNAYIQNKEYANAISAYQVYLEFYKLDYDSPKVVYNLGLAYHKLYKGKGRRIDYQQQALVAFAELKKTYPEFYRNSNADELEVISTNRILDNEIHVASLYIRLKEFNSAVERLGGTATDFPDSKSLPQAQFLLAKAYYKQGDREGFDKTLEFLNANWSGSKYTKKAAKLWKS